MAGFGLGLGAFTQGFANGVGLGQRWDQVRRQNSDRDAIDKVNTEAKSAFDADVAAGSTTPDKWNDYFSTNVLPKLSQTYAQQGNMEGARYAQQWGESEAAKKGVSAFGRLLTAGNFDEAGKAFADLGSAKGYLPGGFVYSGSEAVAGPNGQQGLKIMWRSPDGKAYSQQFGSIDELKQMAAGVLNPEAVAKLHVDQMGWGAEDSRKLGLYRRQKEIDAQPGLQPVQPGFRWNADRTAQEPIPGGPAHPDYLGGKAQATQAPPAGFTQRSDGAGYVPVPGGPADPNYIEAAEGAKSKAKGGGRPDAEAEGKFRKEVAARAQPYQVMRDAYGRMVSAGDDAAGDIALIFSFMRMLDPGSVVREGEFATAQNAAGIPDQIRNVYNRALEGTRLNPNQRGQFRQQGKAYYDNAARDYQALEQQFVGAAQVYGYDPERVIPRYPPMPSDAPSTPASSKDQGRVTQGGPTRQPNYAPGGSGATPDPLGIR